MTAAAILARAEAVGLTLTAEGGTLRVRGPRRPSPELLAALQRHKQDLLLLLDLRAAASGMPREPDEAGQSPDPPLPPGAAAWLDARSSPLPGCCVGVGDAVADFLAHTPDGDALALVQALAGGAVPRVRIAVTANSTRLLVGLRIGNCPVLNASHPAKE